MLLPPGDSPLRDNRPSAVSLAPPPRQPGCAMLNSVSTSSRKECIPDSFGARQLIPRGALSTSPLALALFCHGLSPALRPSETRGTASAGFPIGPVASTAILSVVAAPPVPFHPSAVSVPLVRNSCSDTCGPAVCKAFTAVVDDDNEPDFCDDLHEEDESRSRGATSARDPVDGVVSTTKVPSLLATPIESHGSDPTVGFESR